MSMKHSCGNKRTVRPLATLQNYQSPKPVKPINDNHLYSDRDERFHTYANALKEGDLDTCNQLRKEHAADIGIITRFDTLERIWISEMSSYVREIQIERREKDAWKTLALAYKQRLKSGDDVIIGTTKKITRGESMLKQVENARSGRAEIELPSGFSKPK